MRQKCNYFFFLLPEIYAVVCGCCPLFVKSSTKTASSPTFTIWQTGMKSSGAFLKKFQEAFSPGTTSPCKKPLSRLNTTSTICPSLRPSTTLTTSLHLSSRNEVSIWQYMSQNVRKCSLVHKPQQIIGRNLKKSAQDDDDYVCRSIFPGLIARNGSLAYVRLFRKLRLRQTTFQS